MKTHFDPLVRAAEERVERARHALQSHVEEIGRRFKTVGSREGIERWIADHPWRSVAIAAGLGAFAGLAGGAAKGSTKVERSLGGMTMAALGAVVVKLVKGVAVEHAADALRSWLAARGGEGEASERAASTDPSVEAFFDH